MSLDLSQIQSDITNLQAKAQDSQRRADGKLAEAKQYQDSGDQTKATSAQQIADKELADLARYQREVASMETDAQNAQAQIDSLNQQADDLENQAKAKRDEAAKLGGSGSAGFSLF